jgi:hypothetical protein
MLGDVCIEWYYLPRPFGNIIGNFKDAEGQRRYLSRERENTGRCRFEEHSVPLEPALSIFPKSRETPI